MRIRVMTEQDIPAGLRLNTLSGWNQTSADWERFLASSPQGCFVMEDGTKVVGTAATICYENRFAWIGMVLVDPEYRKQGIGTQLLNKSIEHLDHSNISTIKLDATPLGKPLYAKLGFVNEFEIERWVLKRPPGTILTIPSSPTAPLTEYQEKLIFTLDTEITGWRPGNAAKRLVIGLGSGREASDIQYRVTDGSGKKVLEGKDTVRTNY